VAGALEGIRVLDCSQIIAGPLASQLLSEMGADVVKVEPLEGEPWRLQSEFMPKESRPYINQNRGKRGIALDLKRREAEPVRTALVRWADVLVTNYRPGVAASLKLDYDSVRVVRPDIIYCENTAFGKFGPDAQRRGYDIVAQAMSGLITSNGVIQNGIPRIVQFAPADALTGALMAWAITAALFHREKTGEGQAINSSLLLTALYLQAGFKEIVALDVETRASRLASLAAARARGASMEEIYQERSAATPELMGNVYYRPYQTQDGYLAVGCLGPEPRARFRAALGIHDRRYDPDFDPAKESMAEVGQALVATVEEIMRGRTTAEWLKHFDAYDIAAGPVRFVEELWEDPQVLANGYIAEYEHSLLGTLRASAPAVSMSATPTRVQRASPALGEHNDEVLSSIGFSPEQIETLRAGGVIR
jgi:crotonobetainyl-CoA:carnitine CoA-transferase CaiB-like acyl-CoA transferase